MPRTKRKESPTGVYHWICRGIHKKDLFHRPSDFEFFKKLLREYKEPHEIRIYHYCLMTNHAHLLMQSPSLSHMAKFSQLVQRRYAYYYCGAYRWVGNVFQRGYRSLPIDKDAYLLECGRYIERNPVKSHLVNEPSEYLHSSYHFYGKQTQDDLIEPSPAYLGLAEKEEDRMAIYTEFLAQSAMSEELIQASQVPF